MLFCPAEGKRKQRYNAYRQSIHPLNLRASKETLIKSTYALSMRVMVLFSPTAGRRKQH
jgi:hypothetical protein